MKQQTILESTINNLSESVRKMVEVNNQFQSNIKTEIESTKNKVKNAPVNLEADILQACQTSINDSIKSCLTGYDSPLSKLILSVVEENTGELRKIISDSFTQVIRTEDFKKSILDAFSHKVARNIISNNDSLFDKVGNDLKQDPIFKAKMALAVSNVVEECLQEKNANPR